MTPQAYVSIAIIVAGIICAYIMYDNMTIRCILSQRNLCAIKSSCLSSKVEGFRYPASMTEKSTMNCTSILDACQEALLSLINNIANMAPHEYLASSSIHCLNLLEMGRQCTISQSSPSQGVFERNKKKVHFSDEVDTYNIESDDDDLSFNLDMDMSMNMRMNSNQEDSYDQALSIPQPLLDLTQIYGPDINDMADAQVDCVNIGGKTYCQVKEMNM